MKTITDICSRMKTATWRQGWQIKYKNHFDTKAQQQTQKASLTAELI